MSDSRIHRLSATALLAVLLLTTSALPGCAGLPVPGVNGGGGGSEPDGEGAVAGTVPSDFPAEIPLIEGEILSGVSLGSEGAKVWSILIKVDDGSAFDEISSQLEGAGFVASGLGGTTELGSTGTFTKPPYAISLVVSGGSSEGWAAKYTVAEDGS